MTQYTLRNVPEAVDRALRLRAYREHKSLNQVTLEVLAEAVDVNAATTRKRLMDAVAGSWCEDPETERALEDQRRIDPALWR